jgi:hypothetical protein
MLAQEADRRNTFCAVPMKTLVDCVRMGALWKISRLNAPFWRQAAQAFGFSAGAVPFSLMARQSYSSRLD